MFEPAPVASAPGDLKPFFESRCNGAFVVALVRRQMSFAILHDVLLDTARMSALMFTILFGAIVFSNFVNIASQPSSRH